MLRCEYERFESSEQLPVVDLHLVQRERLVLLGSIPVNIHLFSAQNIIYYYVSIYITVEGHIIDEN